MSEISIIVPVYNAAAYLRKSLDSIVNQSYRDIEFIFVDDGSCDDSLAILKEYEAADKRVTVLHQENRGAGAARNYGMVNFHSKCKMVRRSFGVLQQSIPVPSSSRGPFSADCLYGIFPS